MSLHFLCEVFKCELVEYIIIIIIIRFRYKYLGNCRSIAACRDNYPYIGIYTYNYELWFISHRYEVIYHSRKYT